MISSTSNDGTAVTRPANLPSLTSLRIFAAAGVFLFHASDYVRFASPSVGERYLGLVTMGGWLGLSFFFILSGFVLTWNVRPGDRAVTFWRRRAVRIYPNHLVTFVATAILMATVLAAPFDVASAFANSFLVQAWSSDLDMRISFNSVSWSLSAEMFFYLCFPLLLLVVRRIRAERLWAWAIAVMAAITLGVPLASSLLPDQPMVPFVDVSMSQLWIIFHFPPVRMLEFVLGMLLARIVMDGRRLPVSFGGAMALTVVAYALGSLFPPAFRLVAVLAVPLALLIATAAERDRTTVRPTLLSLRPMVYLGNLSFAFYLLHLQVLVYATRWLGFDHPVGVFSGALQLTVLFGIALALSMVLYHGVEMPLMRRFGAAPRPRRSVRPPTTGEPVAEPRTGVVGAPH